MKLRRMVFVANGHDEVLKRWSLNCILDDLAAEGVVTTVVDLMQRVDDRELSGVDAIMVYRSFDLKTKRLMERMRAMGVFVLFNVDDYVFQPRCRFAGGAVSLETMAVADCLVASTEELLVRMPFNKPKILRGPVLNTEMATILQQEYRRGDVFSIGWTIGKGRWGIMDAFVAKMLTAMNDRMSGQEMCVFQYFGSRSLPKLKRVDIKENGWFAPEDWKGLYGKLKEFDLGVVINPMDEKDEFCMCKAELKFVESAAMGVPLVVSRIPPYLGFIQDGVNGFFASTPDEFADKLLLIMRNPALSRRVSAEAKRLVMERYDSKRVVKKFVEDIEEAMIAVRANKDGRE